MTNQQKFLIIDGYPKPSRDDLSNAGMKQASVLYSELLLRHLPEAAHDIFYSSDPGVILPDGKGITVYDGILWTGCNLTINDTGDERVSKVIDLCRMAYEAGIPQFGSCWGIQLAVFTAGGEVRRNPGGREIGIGRKISLTDEGKSHPMFRGKPQVFSHFESHDDEVTKLPEGATLLAGNDFSKVQAIEVKHRNGTFWATQYHPEYNLHEMARLIFCRIDGLIELGFFKKPKDAHYLVDRFEELYIEPGRRDLRMQLGIDDDILSEDVRQCEFSNWIKEIVE